MRPQLRRIVDELKRDPEQANKRIADQQNRITEQQEQIAEQQKQVRKLEREVADSRRNSTNSSKPPSSDGLAGQQRERGRKPGTKCKRRAGGQSAESPMAVLFGVDVAEQHAAIVEDAAGGNGPDQLAPAVLYWLLLSGLSRYQSLPPWNREPMRFRPSSGACLRGE